MIVVQYTLTLYLYGQHQCQNLDSVLNTENFPILML